MFFWGFLTSTLKVNLGVMKANDATCSAKAGGM